MFRFINKTSIVVVASLGLAVLTGCASGSAGVNGATTKPSAAAMQCPKCETVWVATSTSHGTKIQRYASERKMTCPDCDEQAASYLKEGKQVLHDCPMCQVAPTPLTPAPQPSHPKGTHS